MAKATFPGEFVAKKGGSYGLPDGSRGKACPNPVRYAPSVGITRNREVWE